MILFLNDKRKIAFVAFYILSRARPRTQPQPRPRPQRGSVGGWTWTRRAGEGVAQRGSPSLFIIGFCRCIGVCDVLNTPATITLLSIFI